MKFSTAALFIATTIFKGCSSSEHVVIRQEDGKRQNAPKVSSRELQTYQYVTGDSCPSMNGSLVPPDDSTCWQWWTPPPSGILSANDNPPTKGCDYTPCEQAVCDCDPYCCETAWDNSCRGYKFNSEEENNYFVDKCSASIICCEPESAFPDFMPEPAIPEMAPATPNLLCTEQNYMQGDVCPCMEGNPIPPDDSTCWQWWTPPADGVLSANDPPPAKGCDYAPCEKAVCDCDDYCCETAWDESCRGYKFSGSGIVEDNYFAQGCSAAILCCEPESAYPDFIISGYVPGEPQYNYYPVPEPIPQYNPVPNPVPVEQPEFIPIPTPEYVYTPVYEPKYVPNYVPVAPALPQIQYVPVPSPPQIQYVPVASPPEIQVVPVPSPPEIKYLPVPQFVAPAKPAVTTEIVYVPAQAAEPESMSYNPCKSWGYGKGKGKGKCGSKVNSKSKAKSGKSGDNYDGYYDTKPESMSYPCKSWGYGKGNGKGKCGSKANSKSKAKSGKSGDNYGGYVDTKPESMSYPSYGSYSY